MTGNWAIAPPYDLCSPIAVLIRVVITHVAIATSQLHPNQDIVEALSPNH